MRTVTSILLILVCSLAQAQQPDSTHCHRFLRPEGAAEAFFRGVSEQRILRGNTVKGVYLVPGQPEAPAISVLGQGTLTANMLFARPLGDRGARFSGLVVENGVALPASYFPRYPDLAYDSLTFDSVTYEALGEWLVSGGDGNIFHYQHGDIQTNDVIEQHITGFYLLANRVPNATAVASYTAEHHPKVLKTLFWRSYNEIEAHPNRRFYPLPWTRDLYSERSIAILNALQGSGASIIITGEGRGLRAFSGTLAELSELPFLRFIETMVRTENQLAEPGHKFVLLTPRATLEDLELILRNVMQ